MQELRMVFHRPLIFALFLAILLTAGQAQATITSYGSRALFDAAVPAPLVENWPMKFCISNWLTAKGWVGTRPLPTVVPCIFFKHTEWRLPSPQGPKE